MPYEIWHLLKSNQRDVRVCFYPITWKMMSIRHAFIFPRFLCWCYRACLERKKHNIIMIKTSSTCLNIKARGGCNYGNYLEPSKVPDKWKHLDGSETLKGGIAEVWIHFRLTENLLHRESMFLFWISATFKDLLSLPPLSGYVWRPPTDVTALRRQPGCTQTDIWKTLTLLMGIQNEKKVREW